MEHCKSSKHPRTQGVVAYFAHPQVKMFSLERTLLAEATLSVSINAVNDPPTVTTPAFEIVVDEDASYAGLPGVFVTDPDAHEEPGGVLEVSSFCRRRIENPCGSQRFLCSS